MAIRSRVQIKGLRELGQALKGFGDEVTLKVVRRATAAAAQPIKERAVQLAPVAPEPYVIEGIRVLPENIQRNIVVVRVKPSETDFTSEHLVTMRGKAKYGYASRVGALQEFGTVNMPAQPFMRPSFDTQKGQALKAMVDTLKKGVDTAAKKARKTP